MATTFALVAIADDGNTVTPTDAENMGLPHSYGWGSWGVLQGDIVIADFPDFTLAQRTCSALNATVFLQAA